VTDDTRYRIEKDSTLADKKAPEALLINIADLVQKYYQCRPVPEDPE